MDGSVFGPYSAKGMMELDVLPDIMVTEDSIDTWQPAEKFDFAKLAKEEVIERLKSTPTNDISKITSPLKKRKEELKARLKNHGNLCPPIKKPDNFTIPNTFPNSIEYNANFNEGINSIGGKIIITPTQLIFHPHKINLGDLSDRIYEISQISDCETGPLTFLYIHFLDGSKIKLTVWNKSEIIEQLESRRNALNIY